MEISYENRMNMVFDKPLEYKGIYLYPATLFDYGVFVNADEYLDISRMEEKDIDLLRLPYLEYVYKKAQKDDGFKLKYEMLLYILHVVLKDQEFDIIEKDGGLCLKVYQRTDKYQELEEKYNKIKNDVLIMYQKTQNLQDINIKKNILLLDDYKKIMFSEVFITCEEFDEIRQLIMEQNDIKSEHYPKHIEDMLYENKKKLSEINSDNTTIEDLISVVSYMTGISMKDMSEMTIRRFHRYYNLIRLKDDYYLYKGQELAGTIEMKSPLPYWISHYEPKGKFDDVLIKNSPLLSQGDKI